MQPIREGTQVIVVIGSQSDEPELAASGLFEVLDRCGIIYHSAVISADRNPDILREFCDNAKEVGVRVFIAGAGRAARLPGTIAAHMKYIWPVIGVALPSKEFPGADDAMRTITRTPGGCPLAYAGDGKTGFKNAALIAVQILANGEDEMSMKIRNKLVAYYITIREDPQVTYRTSSRKGE